LKDSPLDETKPLKKAEVGKEIEDGITISKE